MDVDGGVGLFEQRCEGSEGARRVEIWGKEFLRRDFRRL